MRIAVVAVLVLAIAFNSSLLFFFAALLLALRLAARLWVERVGAGLRVERRFERRIFHGETVEVAVTVSNTSALPAPWLRLRDHLPPALILPSVYSEVFTLGAGRAHRATYRLLGRRRGFHALGPLTLTVGDVLAQAQRVFTLAAAQYLIVYPRVLPLESLGLPTQALFGDLRSRHKIVGDPARLAGVRAYVPGDPLHYVHWRATARAGALQTKQFQPSTAVQTMIFLDMARDGYTLPDVPAATDLAVTLAASVAAYMIERRQEVGLASNGRVALPPSEAAVAPDLALLLAGAAEPDEDAIKGNAGRPLPRYAAAPLRAGKGHGHLMRILELLARLEIADEGAGFAALLREAGLELPWGTTVVAITGSLGDELFAALHRLREAGLLVVLLDVERRPDHTEMQARAAALGVRLRIVGSEDAFQAMAGLETD